jgi:hypothetical protein
MYFNKIKAFFVSKNAATLPLTHKTKSPIFSA